ncbi:hypothetical protein BDZ89DRAFT_1144575 [Hymenopellis radicata]|nr:hypothetical protein BDZ89DRAFT_1144575 [Hymenopellis radicata]
MSQPTPTYINVFSEVPLLPSHIDATDPLFPVLDDLKTSSLLPIVEKLVVPAFDAIGIADMIRRADGRFCPPEEHKTKVIHAHAVVRDGIYYGFNKVLAEDVQSEALSEGQMLEFLEQASETSTLAKALHRGISYIPAFQDDAWPTQAEAFAHVRTNLLYLNRLIGCLTAMIKVSMEEGIAYRWNYGADETWDAFDFLSTVSPGLIQYEAARCQMTVLELKESYHNHRAWEGFSPKLGLFPDNTNSFGLFQPDTSCGCSSAPTPNGSTEDLDALSTLCQPSMSREELDRMDEMFYHPDKLDFRWIDELTSDSELEVLEEYDPEQLYLREERTLEESEVNRDSWPHVADFDKLEMATATRLSNESYQHDSLGLIGPEEYLQRLDDNIPMSLANYSGFLDDENSFYPPFLATEDSDSESLSSELTYLPNSDLDLLTDDSDDEVILAMRPFGRRLRRGERYRHGEWDY